MPVAFLPRKSGPPCTTRNPIPAIPLLKNQPWLKRRPSSRKNQPALKQQPEEEPPPEEEPEEPPEMAEADDDISIDPLDLPDLGAGS